LGRPLRGAGVSQDSLEPWPGVDGRDKPGHDGSGDGKGRFITHSAGVCGKRSCIMRAASTASSRFRRIRRSRSNSPSTRNVVGVYINPIGTHQTVQRAANVTPPLGKPVDLRQHASIVNNRKEVFRVSLFSAASVGFREPERNNPS
jgi:hypothetical protein